MPRLLHLADVHLGARHHDLGEAAATQRERQFDAFRRAIDLALAEKVDVVLVAGDLFDSNQQPRRSVDRAAAEFGRLAAAGIRTVVIPGTHDVYDPSSIYRINDLAAMAGLKPASEMIVVLTPERPEVVFSTPDLIVFSRVAATKRMAESPLAGFASGDDRRARWRVGLIHGSLRVAGVVEADDVLFTDDEVAASGLHYLALGHWHSFRQGIAGETTWAYAGAPEPVAVDQDGAGQVLIVDLEERDGRDYVSITPSVVGRTTFRHVDVDAAEVASQAALVEQLKTTADADLVLDVRIVGILPDELELQDEEIERQLASSFFKVRVRSRAVPAEPEGPLPPPDTIVGGFIRDLEARIAAADKAGDTEGALELRDSLRLGRILLADPARIHGRLMRLKRLRLTDLQRHADLDLEFAPGLTIVRGPNEAGKTTIERAIEYGLFRKVTAAGQDVEGLRRWGAPEEAAPTVRIDFTDHDGVDGSLSKVFAGAKGRVELIVGGESITDPAEVERQLAELTGIPSEKFFRSTAAVRHEELADLDRDESTLRDRLQEAMSGADRGTGAARKKLVDAIARYTAAGAKNPGIIKSLTDTTTILEASLRDGEAALGRLEEERAALSRARDALAVAEQRLEVDRDSLAAAERAVALKRRQDDAQSRYEKYRRAAELRDEIEAKDAVHPSRLPLVALRASVERIRDLEAKISEYRAELAEEPDLSSYDVGALPTPEWRRPAIIGLVLTVVGVGLAVAGAVGTINLGPIGQIPTFVAFAIAAIGVALDVLAIVRQRRSKDVGRQNVLRNEQISRRLRGRSEIEQAMHDAEAKRAQELTNIDLPDLPTAESLLAAETEHVAAIDQLKAELRGLLAGETPSDDLARLRDVAANEVEQARHALAGMGDVGQDPQRALDRSSSAVRLGIAERERTLRESAEAEGRVKANDVDAEQVAATAEQLAAARDRLLAAERRLRVTTGTLEALDRAVEGTMKKAARFLEKRMATDVARITGGRYRRIRVDENALTFSVWSMERSDWVDVRDLSQGTLDQFYLAARLGLVRQVTRDRRPPMIFDDPFLTFDDERAREALQLMRETAADLQVIYLTTSDRYDAIADAVVVLEAPTVLDVAADEVVLASSAATTVPVDTEPVAGA